jgi:hypothetical protein
VLYLFPSAKICQRAGDRKNVNDVVSFAVHADGLCHFVDLDRKSQSARNLAGNFFGRRMDDVQVRLPGREYAKQYNEWAQPSETSQGLL